MLGGSRRPQRMGVTLAFMRPNDEEHEEERITRRMRRMEELREERPRRGRGAG